jgi:hypothetical protein
VPRTFRVGFATCRVEGIFQADPSVFSAALQESWQGGVRATRYGRTWHLSRPQADQANRVWAGRIGFVREDDVSTVIWDDDAQDFVLHGVPGGVIVPFAIALDTSVAAYQLRSGVVRPTTFTGALQSLLNEASRTYGWEVRPLVAHATFEQWQAQVAQITEFNFRLERPNPHYHDNDRVEDLIEALRLQVASLRGRAREGEAVNIESDTFRQFLDHVRRDHGRGVVRGELQDREETEWRSSDGGVVPATRAVESSDAEEIDTADLITAVLDPPADARPQAEVDPDDSEA